MSKAKRKHLLKVVNDMIQRSIGEHLRMCRRCWTHKDARHHLAEAKR